MGCSHHTVSVLKDRPEVPVQDVLLNRCSIQQPLNRHLFRAEDLAGLVERLPWVQMMPPTFDRACGDLDFWLLHDEEKICTIYVITD